jgi:hypothetical protein
VLVKVYKAYHSIKKSFNKTTLNPSTTLSEKLHSSPILESEQKVTSPVKTIKDDDEIIAPSPVQKCRIKSLFLDLGLPNKPLMNTSQPASQAPKNLTNLFLSQSQKQQHWSSRNTEPLPKPVLRSIKR